MANHNDIGASSGRDGALRRPPARAFLSPAGRLFKIPLAKNGEAPAGASQRDSPCQEDIARPFLPDSATGRCAAAPTGWLTRRSVLPVWLFVPRLMETAIADFAF